jgi:hypothetical protein
MSVVLQQDFIEGEYDEVGARDKKALPPPAELLRFEPQNKEIFDSVPAKRPRTLYKGK